MIDVAGVPDVLTDANRWLMWSTDSRTPRRPHVAGDYGVAFNDPDNWLSFEDAVKGAQVRETWGVGFVFTPDRDLFAVDVDGAIGDDRKPREWFPGHGPFRSTYIEWSPSGTGFHYVLEGRPPQWWRDCEIEGTHQGVEVLGNSFCTITGDRVDDSRPDVQPIEQADTWFAQVFHEIRGHLPGMEDAHPDQATLSDAAGARGAERNSESFERELGSVAPDSFPPCVDALTERVRMGEPMNHKARFALAAFLSNVGMSAQEVVDYLEVSSEFGQDETTYQVEHIADDYDPPSCSTMLDYGLCTAAMIDDRCETIGHPLAYYEGEKQ